MSEIAELRSRIDALDNDLVRLLNERAEVAKDIGAFKHREGLPIYSPEREDHVLRKLVEKSPGPLSPDSLKAIYREIMSASLALEKDISIACLGPSGSTTHQASRDKFGSSVKYLILPDVESVFKEVEAGNADCGVVPIDEAEHGIMSSTLDGLAESDLSICAQIVLPCESGDETRHASRLFVLGKSANPRVMTPRC
jgi:chorismate mutase/prephenate dehydratase